jgi:hypothetical protein
MEDDVSLRSRDLAQSNTIISGKRCVSTAGVWPVHIFIESIRLVCFAVEYRWHLSIFFADYGLDNNHNVQAKIGIMHGICSSRVASCHPKCSTNPSLGLGLITWHMYKQVPAGLKTKIQTPTTAAAHLGLPA